MKYTERDKTLRRNVKGNEKDQEFALHILEAVNKSSDKVDFINDLLLLIKVYTKCESVGIRLNDGNDFPYYRAEGFSKSFVESETYLCKRDLNGKIVETSDGTPCLECMCGRVICGKTNPSF